MKLGKIVVENKFFIKLLLTYCLVIFLGLGFTSYFVTTRMIDILTEKESQIENEALRKVRAYSEDKHNTIKSIFARLYIQQYFNDKTSIVGFINPDKAAQVNENAKLSAITSYLHDTCTANSFISDFFVIDYSGREVFFYSNVAGRDVSIDYDFYRTDFLGRDKIDNTIAIIPNNIPDYINISSVNNFPVITYCLYLFDGNSVKFDKPLGMAVVNIRADFFKEAYKGSAGFRGNIFVLSGDGLVLFDSAGSITGELFPFETYSAEGLSSLKSNERYVINKLFSEETGFTFVDVTDRLIIAEETGGIRKSINNTITVCILITLIISLGSASMFTKRIKSLVRNMQDVENGRLETRTEVGADDEIGYLEQSFNTMCEKLEEYIKNVYVFEIKTKTAELKALQAQINPHFLFNTLESIRVTAQINGDVQAAKMIHILGEMFRWNIKMKGMFVDLKEEMDYVRSYIELQKLRYDNSLTVSTETESAALKLGVPKLLLQPLVENSISHGLSDMDSGGHIWIKAYIDSGSLVIKVTDNGKGIDENKVKEVTQGLSKDENDRIGLSNIHQRISILFGNNYGLSICSEFGKGTEMTVSIPALSKEEMEGYVQGGNS